jgi:glutamyl-tRNA synthetase
MPDKSIRIRFAPSPTGYFHVGGARTALFDWLFARHHGGSFILRIEDTDRSRYTDYALRDLLEGLRWLGLDWDEGPEVGGKYGPYFQSQRLPIYHEYAHRLVESGHAYYCYCSEDRLQSLHQEQKEKKQPHGYDRRCRALTAKQRADYEAQGIQPVVRLMVPLEGQIIFQDAIRGTITVDAKSLNDDKILLKSDGFPTYHLAAPIDDHLMEISHVTRADEWLPSMPYSIILFQALGWTPPIHAHLPIVLSPTGKGKLSKRHGASSVLEFRKQGFLPEALINFLARLGWSYDDKTEVFTREELIRYFDLSGINPAPGQFSYDRLEWLNGHYIRQSRPDELAKLLLPFLQEAGLKADLETTTTLVPLIQERIKTLDEAAGWVDFLFAEEAALEYDPALLVQKKTTAEDARRVLARSLAALEILPAFTASAIEEALRPLADELGLKAREFFGTLRIACTGKEVAPPLFESLAILGKEATLSRLKKAQALLGANA